MKNSLVYIWGGNILPQKGRKSKPNSDRESQIWHFWHRFDAALHRSGVVWHAAAVSQTLDFHGETTWAARFGTKWHGFAK